MQGGATSLEELERLVRALERSGLAEMRPDVAALLARSRARLAAPPRRRRRRVAPRARALALGRGALDLAALLAGAVAVGALAFGAGAAAWAPAVLGAALLWGGLRGGHALAGLAQDGAGRLAWGARWTAFWLAEPFSERAYLRLEAMEEARLLMQAWQRHRRGLLGAPALADVTALLGALHGPHLARRFAALAEARRLGEGSWTLRGRDPRPWPEARLLRWSELIGLFEALAASGALWAPEPAPVPAPTPLPAAPPPPPIPEESPERRQRRIDLRELIRRKRQDINTAHGWKLKTAAEVAQRDSYLNTLREEIAALEAELATLGPEPGAVAPARIRLSARG
jgi:hypothetical protein